MRLTGEKTRKILKLEIGDRAVSHLDIENSDWAYRMWWTTGRYWWDADTNQFIRETRPDFLSRIEQAIARGEWDKYEKKGSS